MHDLPADPGFIYDVSEGDSESQATTTCVVNKNNTATCWTENYPGFLVEPGMWSMSAGESNACGLKTNGTACIGDIYDQGTARVPANLGRAALVLSSKYQTCAMTPNPPGRAIEQRGKPVRGSVCVCELGGFRGARRQGQKTKWVGHLVRMDEIARGGTRPPTVGDAAQQSLEHQMYSSARFDEPFPPQSPPTPIFITRQTSRALLGTERPREKQRPSKPGGRPVHLCRCQALVRCDGRQHRALLVRGQRHGRPNGGAQHPRHRHGRVCRPGGPHVCYQDRRLAGVLGRLQRLWSGGKVCKL